MPAALAAGVGAADFMGVEAGSAAARAALAEEDITEVVALAAVALEVMAEAETAADLVAVVSVDMAVAALAVMVLVEEEPVNSAAVVNLVAVIWELVDWEQAG